MSKEREPNYIYFLSKWFVTMKELEWKTKASVVFFHMHRSPLGWACHLFQYLGQTCCFPVYTALTVVWLWPNIGFFISFKGLSGSWTLGFLENKIAYPKSLNTLNRFWDEAVVFFTSYWPSHKKLYSLWTDNFTGQFFKKKGTYRFMPCDILIQKNCLCSSNLFYWLS